jgi:hypothetical protein
MKRLIVALASLAVVLALAAPAVLAADPAAGTNDRVLLAFGGDLDVPAGERAEFVLVAGGDLTISGEVRTVVILDGTATLTGASVEDVVAVSSTLTLGPATLVMGDIREIESTVEQSPNAIVEGTVRGLDAELFMLGSVLAPAFLLFAIGFALTTVVAGLLLAALGSRQVRAAERIFVTRPGATFLVGLLAVIVVPVLAVMAMVTIIGAPLGLTVLFAAWPAAAYLGYLVAGIVVGERIISRPGTERPYLAAVVGLLVLQVLGLVPVVGGLVTGIASLFGFGAIILLAWETIRGPGRDRARSSAQAPMPTGA